MSYYRPKHRARKTLVARRLESLAARERADWFMAGRIYPSAAGKHVAEVA